MGLSIVGTCTSSQHEIICSGNLCRLQESVFEMELEVSRSLASIFFYRAVSRRCGENVQALKIEFSVGDHLNRLQGNVFDMNLEVSNSIESISVH